MIKASKLHFYSVGIVAANKLLTSKIIEVTPVEDLPMLNGELTDNISKYSATAKDASGNSYAANVSTTVTVKAMWLPIGSSNRITAPDVRRGETVIIYRFADSDEFFWGTLKDDSHLRKLETVVYAFSGTKIEDTKMDASNTYFLEISTHSKTIHLHTSKANGEPFSYDIQLNTAEGYLQIQDDDGNFIKFDSAERHIIMVNRDQSKVEIDKRIINFSSLDEVNIKTKKITTTAQDVLINATNVTTTTTNDTTNATNILINGSSQVRIAGGNFVLATQTSSVI